MVTISLTPRGALTVRIPVDRHATSWKRHQCTDSLHLDHDHEAPPRWEFSARAILEPWTHEGPETPLPGHATGELPTVSPLAWDVTTVTRRAAADILFLPKNASFPTARALQRIAPTARVSVTCTTSEGSLHRDPHPTRQASPC